MAWYFEDFVEGQTFATQRRTITESDIVMFAGWSWDTNPVHTDAVHAQQGRFGDRIGHGLLGMAVAMGLASRLGVFEACSVALLEVANWRFLAPIKAGDTLRAEVLITGTRLTSSGSLGILNRHFRLLNSDDVLVQEGDIDLMVSVRSEAP